MRGRLLLSAAAAAGLLGPPGAQAADPYGATYAPSPLSCLTPGQVKTHKVGLINTGTNYWTLDDPSPYHLAYHWYQQGAPVIYEGDRTLLPKVVGSVSSALQNTITLDANLTAPPALGTYTLRWDMVHELVTWFSDQGVPTGDQAVEVKASCPPSLEILCLKIDCGALFQPRIERIIPFISNSTPGGYLAIAGSGFGEIKGKVWIRGMKRWNGTDYGGTGNVLLEVDDPPGEDHWQPKIILAQIHPFIIQVKDQKVKLQVQTSSGRLSNLYEIDFQAARESKLLPYDDPAVKRTHCGTESTLDRCNGWTDPDDDTAPAVWNPVWDFSTQCGQTLWGWHANFWHGTDSDTDTYEIQLKNGWAFASMDWKVSVSSGGEAAATQPSGFAPGTSFWKPQVPYWVTYDEHVCYGVNLLISGPKGVPWK